MNALGGVETKVNLFFEKHTRIAAFTTIARLAIPSLLDRVDIPSYLFKKRAQPKDEKEKNIRKNKTFAALMYTIIGITEFAAPLLALVNLQGNGPERVTQNTGLALVLVGMLRIVNALSNTSDFDNPSVSDENTIRD